jgi:hypothetical protein
MALTHVSVSCASEQGFASRDVEAYQWEEARRACEKHLKRALTALRAGRSTIRVALDYVRKPEGGADQIAGQSRGISMASAREDFVPAAAANVRQALAMSGLPFGAGGSNRMTTRARAFAMPR